MKTGHVHVVSSWVGKVEMEDLGSKTGEHLYDHINGVFWEVLFAVCDFVAVDMSLFRLPLKIRDLSPKKQDLTRWNDDTTVDSIKREGQMASKLASSVPTSATTRGNRSADSPLSKNEHLVDAAPVRFQHIFLVDGCGYDPVTVFNSKDRVLAIFV